MRRYAFRIGTAAIAAGVACHVPDFVAARSDRFRMAGMPMGQGMVAGMALIVAGLALAVWGLLPSAAERARAGRRRSRWPRWCCGGPGSKPRAVR